MVRGVLVQVRIDSTRLYGKALLDLGGKKVIELVLEALKEIKVEKYILVTTHDSYDVLAPYAQRAGFDCFAGSKKDVLLRYVTAVKQFNIDRIIRATGDNPLVSPSLAELALQSHKKEKADYTGLLKMPIGTGVEIIERNALECADKETDTPFNREHVAPYLYNNPSLFKINRPDAPKKYQNNGSVTLDTKEDYKRLEKLFNTLYKGKPIPTENVVKWLEEN